LNYQNELLLFLGGEVLRVDASLFSAFEPLRLAFGAGGNVMQSGSAAYCR
jgi:hypothetical protein